MIWLWALGGLVVIFGIVVFRGAPYVPSQKRYINQAFQDLYPLSPDDLLIDIGSGDGIVLRQAAKFGSRAIGYEINPILVALSKLLSRRRPLVSTRLSDYWRVSFPDDTTVVYVFAVKRDTKRVVRKIQNEANRMNHNLHVISYGNKLPGWEPKVSLAAYDLYEVLPLQSDKAQV